MDFLLHILISIGHWLPTVLGYNLVFGKGKILHFGPLGCAIATSYTLFLVLLTTGSYPMGIVAAIAMSIVISLFFSWLSLKLEADGLGVMSIAVHLGLLAIVLNWTSVTRGSLGIPSIPRMSFMESIEMYALVTCTLSLCILGMYFWLERTSFSRQLEALAEHEWHAKSLGVNKAIVHTIAFVILGMSHVFGSLFAIPYYRFLHPNDFHFPALIFLVMVVVAGKPGSVKGVTLATVLLVVLKEALRFLPFAPSVVGPIRLLLFGVILFIAVWYRRDTLFPKQRTV